MNRYARGSTVQFSASGFLNAAGTSMTPAAVTLYIEYPSNARGGRADTSLTMTDGDVDGTWTAEWESAAAFPGTVNYSIRAEGSDMVQKDGQLQLTANPANPDP